MDSEEKPVNDLSSNVGNISAALGDQLHGLIVDPNIRVGMIEVGTGAGARGGHDKRPRLYCSRIAQPLLAAIILLVSFPKFAGGQITLCEFI